MGKKVVTNILGSGIRRSERALFEHLWYNPVTEQVESDRTMRSILSSFKLGDQHTLSSGADNLFFTNTDTGLVWSPMWTGLLDHKITANQGVSGIMPPSGRTYSAQAFEFEVDGPPHATSVVPFVLDTTLAASASSIALTIIPEQEVTATHWLRYSGWSGHDNKDLLTFRHFITGEVAAAGQELHWQFENPIEDYAGKKFQIEIAISENRQGPYVPIQARAAADGVIPYGKALVRLFQDRNASVGVVPTKIDHTIVCATTLAVNTTAKPVTVTLEVGCPVQFFSVFDAEGSFNKFPCHVSLRGQIISLSGKGDHVTFYCEEVSGGANDKLYGTDWRYYHHGTGSSGIVSEGMLFESDMGDHEWSESIDGNNHHTLHDGDAQWLTDRHGNPLQWEPQANELGSSDLILAAQHGIEVIHNGDGQILADKYGKALLWNDESTLAMSNTTPNVFTWSDVDSTNRSKASRQVSVNFGTSSLNEACMVYWTIRNPIDQVVLSTGVSHTNASNILVAPNTSFMFSSLTKEIMINNTSLTVSYLAVSDRTGASITWDRIDQLATHPYHSTISSFVLFPGAVVFGNRTWTNTFYLGDPEPPYWASKVDPFSYILPEASGVISQFTVVMLSRTMTYPKDQINDDKAPWYIKDEAGTILYTGSDVNIGSNIMFHMIWNEFELRWMRKVESYSNYA